MLQYPAGKPFLFSGAETPVPARTPVPVKGEEKGMKGFCVYLITSES